MRLRLLAFGFVATLAVACAESDPIGGSGGSGGSGSGGGSTTSDGSTTTTGEACTEDPCKLTVPQCGCGEAEACSVDASATRVCIPAGSAQPGAACETNASCAPGALCVGYGPGLLSCGKFCDTDADCEAPGGLCAIEPVPGITLCSDNCDLETNAGCQVAGLSCQFSVRDTEPFTLCAPSGAGTQGAACTDTSQCAPGFLCLATQVDESCFKWCDVAAQDCPGGLICQPVEIEAGVPLVIGNTSYGACT